ncbi:MAG: spore coat associated protein CotJA [Clostridia bacterium]|nr:spore coat associated protein CotJA [Clostridia bacterium]
MADNRYNQRRMMPEQKKPNNAILPPDSVPAMLYVPWQTDTNCYDEMKALEKGTLFTALDKPFLGKRCR